MKKFFARNKIICIFGIISISISVSYAITYNMPDYFGIEGWYALLNNISISYIAALIFYVLQVYIPTCENAKRAQMALEPLFFDLIKYIEITIACCRKYVFIDENGKLTIDWCDKEQKVLYFVAISDNANICGHRTAISKSKNELCQSESIYKSKIKDIKERIHFRECDSEILNVLSKLEETDFFSATIKAALMFEGTFIRFSDFQAQVDKLESIKDDFKKCCRITFRYDIRDAEDTEIAACKAIFYKNALQATSIDEFNEITYREYLRLQLEPLVPEETELKALIENIWTQVKVKKDKQ